MQHWQDSEVRELLLIRGEEEIRTQVTGTVRDTMIYKNISKMLSERGIDRSPRQVINKLKALKKKYLAINNQRTTSGMGRVDWPFYELCQSIYSNSALANPARFSGSLASSSSSCSSPAVEDGEVQRDTQGEAGAEAIQGLEVDEDTEASIQAGPALEEGGPETTSTRPSQTSACYVPARRRKRTRVEDISAAITSAMAELKEMDRAAAARDDARMQLFMEHERSLWERQERIIREDRENQRLLFELLLSRLPSSAPQVQQPPQSMHHHEQSQADHSVYQAEPTFTCMLTKPDELPTYTVKIEQE